jgi:hypothetical protein
VEVVETHALAGRLARAGSALVSQMDAQPSVMLMGPWSLIVKGTLRTSPATMNASTLRCAKSKVTVAAMSRLFAYRVTSVVVLHLMVLVLVQAFLAEAMMSA